MMTMYNATGVIGQKMSEKELKDLARNIKPHLLKEFNENDDTNKSLDDLKQKLINIMYEKSFYEQTDIEILKILFENEKETR